MVARNANAVLNELNLPSLSSLTKHTAHELNDLIHGHPEKFFILTSALFDAKLLLRFPDNTRAVDDGAGIGALGLGGSHFNKLQRLGASNIAQVISLEPEQMINSQGFGWTTYKDVYLALSLVGRTFVGGSPSEQHFDHNNDPGTPFGIAMADIARELVEIADVVRHIKPGAVVADALQKFLEDSENEILRAPIESLTNRSADQTSLAARINRFIGGLDSNRSHIFTERRKLAERPALETVAEPLSITRERVRQLETKMGRSLMEDPLVSQRVLQLLDLAPVVTLEFFTQHGFDFSDVTGSLLLAARAVNEASSVATIEQSSIADTEVVFIGTSSDRPTSIPYRELLTGANLSGSVDELKKMIRDVLNWHFQASLLPEDARSLDSLEEDRERIVEALTKTAPVFIIDNDFVATYSKRAFIEGAILRAGEISLPELEELYDRAFPPNPNLPSPSFDRRVSSILFDGPQFVRVQDNIWSHETLGAVPVQRVSEVMDSVFAELDASEIGMNVLIREVVKKRPDINVETVKAYIQAGLKFSETDGFVSQGPSELTNRPEHSSSMFRTPDGFWAWHGQRDDTAMYYSSVGIPPALLSSLGLEIGDHAVTFPTGTATIGVSTTSIYFKSSGGIKEVFDTAAVLDGDRFQIIATGTGTAECRVLNPIDHRNPVAHLTSVLGIANDDSDPTDAVIHAVGLDPIEYDDEELRKRIDRRGSEFAEAFRAINAE